MKKKGLSIVIYALIIALLIPVGAFAHTGTPNVLEGLIPEYPDPYIEGIDGESSLELSYDYVVGEKLNIVVTDKRSGRVWESNPIFNNPDPAMKNEERSNQLMSQVYLTYSFDSNGNTSTLADVGYVSSSSKMNTMYSYVDSITKDQIEIEEMKDGSGKLVGLRVEYGLGSIKAAVFPKFLTQDQVEFWISQCPEEDRAEFEETVYKRYKATSLQILEEADESTLRRIKDDKQRKVREEELRKVREETLDELPILAETTCYSIYSDSINTPNNKKKILELWQKVNYTRESLENDYSESGFNDETTEVGFIIPVEYVIEGNTFRATIKTAEIDYPAEVAILSISLLNGFGSVDETAEGYYLVPDGSGALIQINNPDMRVTSYQTQLMNRNKDEALSQNNMDIRDIPYYSHTTLPVFGMMEGDDGLFCIIEKGYELANILVNVRDDKSKFNRSYTTYYPTVRDNIYYTSGSSSKITMFPKVALEETVLKKDKETKEMVEKIVVRKYCRLPDTDMSQRYVFLKGEDATYVGMAKYLRNYMIQTFGMERIAESQGVPFYADIYGVIDKKINYAGLPITRKFPLTTFEEAVSIVDGLEEADVKDLKVRFMLSVNGGVRQTYSNKVKFVGSMGGNKGFTKFVESMEQRGIDVFPNIDALHVYKDKVGEGFAPKNDAVYTLGKTRSLIFDRNLATGVKDNWAEYPQYYRPRWAVSPKKYPQLFSELKASLDKFDNKFVSIDSAGYILNSEFKEENIVDRSQSARLISDALNLFKQDGYSVMVNKGNFHTLPYVTDIIELNMTSTKFLIEMYEVPFTQMVLHGLVEYSGEAFNETQNEMYDVLKCLEYGAGVYGKFMYEDDSVFQATAAQFLYSMHYKNWTEAAGRLYTKVYDAIGDVRNQFIVNHERLADNVYRTTYEQGKQVVVNYSLSDYTDAEGGWTVKANNYHVIGGGN